MSDKAFNRRMQYRKMRHKRKVSRDLRRSSRSTINFISNHRLGRSGHAVIFRPSTIESVTGHILAGEDLQVDFERRKLVVDYIVEMYGSGRTARECNISDGHYRVLRQCLRYGLIKHGVPLRFAEAATIASIRASGLMYFVAPRITGKTVESLCMENGMTLI
ncbi:MAG: hypothetical protein K9K86_09850 [Pseudomonadales bacterium]|nr:hypothetical protein [Pseudomonadales bacterium]